MTALLSSEVLIAFSVTLLAGLATLIGGAIVLFFKQPTFVCFLLVWPFLFGAMIYISLTEILNKSIHAFSQVFDDKIGFAWGTAAFLAGVVGVLLLDRWVPNPHDLVEKIQHSSLIGVNCSGPDY